MAGKPWSEWEDRKLRAALRRGGVDEAARVLDRSRQAISDRLRVLGWHVLDLGGVRLAGVMEVAAALGTNPNNARRFMHQDPLLVRRGQRHSGIPRCRLQALLAQRPPSVGDFDPATHLTSAQAAIRLGCSELHFRHRIGPTLQGRVEVRAVNFARQYLYPVDLIADLRQSAA